MTKAEYEAWEKLHALPTNELDRLVAAELFGCKLEKREHGDYVCGCNDNRPHNLAWDDRLDDCLAPYSTDWHAMGLAMQRAAELFPGSPSVRVDKEGTADADIPMYGGAQWAEGKSGPHAFAIAPVLAMRSETRRKAGKRSISVRVRPKSCSKCGLRPIAHEALVSRGVDKYLCCVCHVEAGNSPADWHADCMATYRRIKEG